MSSKQNLSTSLPGFVSTPGRIKYKPRNMTAEELYNGYLWIYKEVYTFKNIMKRLPKSKKQWMVCYPSRGQ